MANTWDGKVVQRFGAGFIRSPSVCCIVDIRSWQETRESGALYNVPAGDHVDVQSPAVLLLPSLRRVLRPLRDVPQGE